MLSLTPRFSVARRLLIAVALGMSHHALAQTPNSAASDLLRSAKDALNDLRYDRADTIAREVLGLPGLRRSQKVLAWQVIAASRFPEEGARDSAAARAAIDEVIRLDLDAAFPVDVRWNGLEGLSMAEKAKVFGLAVRLPGSEIVYGGALGDAVIRVATPTPSNTWLIVRTAGAATQVVIDSVVGARDAVFRVPALRGTAPMIATGAYELVVRAVDVRSGAELERTMQASVAAGPIDLLPVPKAIDSTQLRPEIQIPHRVRGTVVGVVFGGLTYALGHYLRAPEPIKSSTSDQRTMLVGAAIAAGAAVAVWFDHGRPLPINRELNAQSRRVNAIAISSTTAENAKRMASYRAKLTLFMDDK